jgi:tRNA nucleotidyltransferase (CCA-adding enzyme)
MKHIKIPHEVKCILKSLTDRGFEAYIVGGAVRDSLLGKMPDDWDICTSALPQQVILVFKNYPVFETGLQHGTVSVLIGKRPIEVTTFRVEGMYSDNRRPDKVEFVKSLKQDLARRDFTINALAYNPHTGLIDYFEGLHDLEHKQIRCVGEAQQRFREDGLRLMRALRFASTYDFTIEKKTAQAIHDNKNLLHNIAAERIQVELNKLLCGTAVKKVLQEFTDVFGVVIPEILPAIGYDQKNPHHIYDLWEHTLESLAYVPPEKVLRLTMLFHDLGKPDCCTVDKEGIGHYYGHSKSSVAKAGNVLKRLKYDKATISTVQTLITFHDLELLPQKKFLKRWLNKIGLDNFRLLLEVQKADNLAKHPETREKSLVRLKKVEELLEEIIALDECFTLQDLTVKGRDLIRIGIKEGPEIGLALKYLLRQVIEERVKNDKEKLLSLAVDKFRKHNN